MADYKPTTSGWGAAYAGIQLATALLDNHYQRSIRRVNQSLLDTQAEARNQVTQARNVKDGAYSSLSLYIQSVNNKRLLDAGADRQVALQGTRRLGQDITASNSAERRMAASHAAGSAAAQAAFTGTIGGAPQRLQAAVALRNARQDQQAKDEQHRRGFYLAEQAGDALSGATASQDNRAILPNRDSSTAVAQALPELDSPMTAALKSGADFGRLIRTAGDLTSYLRGNFADPPAPLTGYGSAPLEVTPGAFSGPVGYFGFQYRSPLDGD